MHYTRWRNHGDPLALIRPQKYGADVVCYADGCDKPPSSKGLCLLHYDRFRANGDPNVVQVDARPATERWKDLYEVTALGYLTPCWLWNGRIGVQGYGRIKDRRKATGVTEPLAHRFVYEQVVGPIPPGLSLDHRCHNIDKACNSGPSCVHRRCVNPDHLEPVSTETNLFRGRTPASINAAKTHCIHGHEFTPKNTNIGRDGKRQCRACMARRTREHRARKTKEE